MWKKYEQYEPPITVICNSCGLRWNEKDVKFIDIEEDMQGRDILTFKCPICHKTTKSLRFG